MQTIVGVLRGGPSREHDVSLQTGAAMIAHLPDDRFIARDIYIDREGVWHDRGRPVQLDRILRQVDVVLNGLHGEYGEDGRVQRVLEQFGVPYSGADSFGAYLTMHKLLTKKRAEEAGLLTPRFIYVSRMEDSESSARAATRGFLQPVVIKPIGWGSSIGVSVASGYAAIAAAITQLFCDGAEGVLIEEYIRGKEATASVVEGLFGEELHALPPVEILPSENNFFSYNAKYSGASREKCPGTFSRVAEEELRHAAKLMHKRLGLRHYSRSDFIVSPKGVYYLETNALPGLTGRSLFPRSLAAVGYPFADFLAHLVNLAIGR